MSTPTGDNAFLHTLELNVRTELTLAETSQPEEEAVSVPIDEWLSDPADGQRYEASLRSLLGAVEVLEDASGPRDHPPPAEVPESRPQKQRRSPMGTMMAPRAHARGGLSSWSTNRHRRRPRAGRGAHRRARRGDYLRGADLGLVVDHP